MLSYHTDIHEKCTYQESFNPQIVNRNQVRHVTSKNRMKHIERNTLSQGWNPTYPRVAGVLKLEKMFSKIFPYEMFNFGIENYGSCNRISD